MLSIKIFTFLFLCNDISHIAIAYSLGDLPADPDGNLLVLVVTLLHWLLGALLPCVVGADLIRDLATRLAGHIGAFFLLNLLAFFVGVGLTGAGDDDPLHVFTLGLPLILAVLLILSLSISPSPRTRSSEGVRGEAS